MIVYISIGNSDDKLSQLQWSNFVAETVVSLDGYTEERHGFWMSLPDAQWQNACWCVEVRPEKVEILKAELRDIADQFNQESIAWAEARDTEFIRPLDGGE